MRVIETERVGDRRVQLVVSAEGVYQVTIAVLGPDLAWADISLQADARLLVREAKQRYQQRVDEQRGRLSATVPVDR